MAVRKFSPDGRFVFIMSRDGWVQKYDLWALKEVGRVRAGLNSRNIAMSKDGKWLAVANYLPHTLTILSTADSEGREDFRSGRRKGHYLARVRRLSGAHSRQLHSGLERRA